MDYYQEFIFYRTYSRWVPELDRRETWEEAVERYCNFLFTKAKNHKEIPEKVKRKIKNKILNLEVMPSMRALWSAGPAAENNNAAMYNCSFLTVDSLKAFSDTMLLLTNGAGVGFNISKEFVNQLPSVKMQRNLPIVTHTVEDSKEGWAEAFLLGLEMWFKGRDVQFDYSKVRPLGTPLKTFGGRASGPEPLRQLFDFARETILSAQGRQLRPIECHDIMCETGSIVVSGGSRRSSLVSLSDLYDEELRYAKQQPFHPRRFLSNNSAIYEEKPDVLDFLDEWTILAKSGTGERGIFNLDAARKNSPHRRKSKLIQGFNPCKPLNSLILTPSGYITIEQALNMESLEVITHDNKKVKASKPFKTGTKNVYKIKLSNGTFLYGTDNHLQMNIKNEWVPIGELKPGDRLKSFFEPIYDTEISNVDRYKLGLLAGWVWGDGSLGERSDGKGYSLQLSFGVHEMDVVELFEEMLEKESKPHGQKPKTCRVINSHRNDLARRLLDEGYSLDKSDLTWLYGKDKDYKLGFICALFTADGSVRNKNNVEIYSIRREALVVLSNILREFGIFTTVGIHNYAKTYITKDGKIRNNKDTWKLNIICGQFLDIGFLSKRKQELLEVTNEKTEQYRYVGYLTVMEIDSEYSVEDVYDINVYDDSHSFIDTGLVTHNCGEILLRPYEMCNLSEVIIRSDMDFDDLRDSITTAVWIGALQSTFTYFPNLSEKFKENCEDERLLGVSLTGQFDNPNLLTEEVLELLKKHANKTARHACKKLDINMSAAITTSKPSGTVSQLTSSASGAHPRYANYYIRRVRISKSDPLFKMLVDQGLKAYQAPENNNTVVLEFPIKSPDNCITRHDLSALDQLKHYKKMVTCWAEHNISTTVYVKPEEWLSVATFVYDNFDIINGVSFFPYENHVYELAPYEEITDSEYLKLEKEMPKIEFTRLSSYENEDYTEGSKTFACVNGACEL